MGYTKRKITFWQRIKCLFGKHYPVYQAHGHGASWFMCKYCPVIERKKDGDSWRRWIRKEIASE